MNQAKSALTECSDCGELNPPWASLNRCVLVCDACCSIHRSLGRHLSQVKSLTSHQWRETQLKMLKQVVTGGSNKVWEYQILDPKRNRDNVKKPRPGDPLHPVKADFIKQKYQFLAFCKRYKESELCSLEDMNMQLHASVRTPNLETSFRLLALGANPNFYHPHKRNTPLHVATQERQGLQVELLLVYGASPTLPDARGATPLSIAENPAVAAAGGDFATLRQALIEAQYELTDRFSLYLCGRQPCHHAQQPQQPQMQMQMLLLQPGGVSGLASHFLLPDRGRSPEKSAAAAAAASVAGGGNGTVKEGRVRLATLPDRAFQELCRDLYDELDRRDNNRIVQHRCQHAAGSLELFFLPLNPHYSSTRNQGRQKLGRLNAREFAAILTDSLEEAARRCGLQPSEMVRARFSRQQQFSSSLDSISDIGALQQQQQQQPEIRHHHSQHQQPQQRCRSEFHGGSGGGGGRRGEEPVYDCVPADSEYASINPQHRMKRQASQPHQQPGVDEEVDAQSRRLIPSSPPPAPLRKAQSAALHWGAGGAEVEAARELQPSSPEPLAIDAEASGHPDTDELATLRASHGRLAEENRQLKQRIDLLMAQNAELSTRLQQVMINAASRSQHQQSRSPSDPPPTPPPPLTPAAPQSSQSPLFRSRNNSAASSAGAASSNYSAGCQALNTGIMLRAGIRQAAAAAAQAAPVGGGDRRPHTTIGQHLAPSHQQHRQQHHHQPHHQLQHHQRYQNLDDLDLSSPPPPPPPPLLLSLDEDSGDADASTIAVDIAGDVVVEEGGGDDGDDHDDDTENCASGVDLDLDEVGCVEIDVDFEAAEGAAAAAAVDAELLDADYDQPPAESSDEGDGGGAGYGDAVRPPCQEEVVARTEAITAEIYKLLEAARQGCHESFPDRADRVRQAVLRMTSIVPKNRSRQEQAARALLSAADTLSAECREPAGPADLSRRTQQVIQCCFDIAKAAKALVTLFQ